MAALRLIADSNDDYILKYAKSGDYYIGDSYSNYRQEIWLKKWEPDTSRWRQIGGLIRRAGAVLGETFTRFTSEALEFLENAGRLALASLLRGVSILGADINVDAFFETIAKFGDVLRIITGILSDPPGFASRLGAGVAAGFEGFFGNWGNLLRAFLKWAVPRATIPEVALPQELNIVNIAGFLLKLLGFDTDAILRQAQGAQNAQAVVARVTGIVDQLAGGTSPGDVLGELLDQYNESVDPADQLTLANLTARVEQGIFATLKDSLRQAVIDFALTLAPGGGLFKTIYSFVVWFIEKAGSVVQRLNELISAFTDTLKGAVSGAPATIINAVKRGIGTAFTFLLDILQNLPGIGPVVTTLKGGLTGLHTVLQRIWTSLIGWFRGLVEARAHGGAVLVRAAGVRDGPRKLWINRGRGWEPVAIGGAVLGALAAAAQVAARNLINRQGNAPANAQTVADGTADPCANLPKVRFSLNGNAKEVAEHIRDALAGLNPKPKMLRYDTDMSRRMMRRNQVCPTGRNRPCASPLSCDEYPFASTYQGGTGASVRCVPSGTNSSQGGTLGNFYTHTPINGGDEFCVEIVP